MAISTYDELKTSIADFLNRDDLASVIPDFITMAEASMNRSVRHWRMEGRATAEIDTKYSAIPADFLEVITFHTTTGNFRPLELLSQGELLQRRQSTQDTSGAPSYYAITAGEIEVYPTPDGTYNTELYYYQRISALSASNTTNWLLTYFPDAYLYGSLIHSAPYLKDDARIQIWAALYNESVGSINRESEASKFGGSGRRMKIRAYT